MSRCIRGTYLIAAHRRCGCLACLPGVDFCSPVITLTCGLMSPC